MDPNCLCIRLQPGGGQWTWEVAYPQGMTGKRGVADTAEHAFALAALALELLGPAAPPPDGQDVGKVRAGNNNTGDGQ